MEKIVPWLFWPYICENKWNVSGNGKQFFISLVCRIFSRYLFSILIMMAIFSLCFVFFLWFQFERSDFLSQCIKFLWFVFHSVRIFFWGDLDWTVFFSHFDEWSYWLCLFCLTMAICMCCWLGEFLFLDIGQFPWPFCGLSLQWTFISNIWISACIELTQCENGFR